MLGRGQAPGRGLPTGRDRQSGAMEHVPAPRHPSNLDNSRGRRINLTAPSSIPPRWLTIDAGGQSSDKRISSVALSIAGLHTLQPLG